MAEIAKLYDSLSAPMKLFIGFMLGMQALAFGAWMVMVLREGKDNEKEKQS
jgi:hypothetical protein